MRDVAALDVPWNDTGGVAVANRKKSGGKDDKKADKDDGEEKKPATSARAGLKPLHVYLPEQLFADMISYLTASEPRISQTAYIESLVRGDLRTRGKLSAKPKPPADA